MDEQELAKEIVAKHSAFPSQMNITSLVPHWPDQIMLDGVLFVREAALRTAQERAADLEKAFREYYECTIEHHELVNITRVFQWAYQGVEHDKPWGPCPACEQARANLKAQADAKGEGDGSESN